MRPTISDDPYYPKIFRRSSRYPKSTEIGQKPGKFTLYSAKNTYGSVQVEVNIIGENGEVYSEDIDDDDDYDYDDDIENMLRSCRYDPKLQQIIRDESCTVPVPSLDQIRSVSQTTPVQEGLNRFFSKSVTFLDVQNSVKQVRVPYVRTL